MSWDFQKLQELIEGDLKEEKLPEGWKIKIEEMGKSQKIILEIERKNEKITVTLLRPLRVTKEIKSKWVGRIQKLDVKTGEEVKTDQQLAVINILGIENEVKMPENGVIKQIFIKEGDIIEYGTPLFSYWLGKEKE